MEDTTADSPDTFWGHFVAGIFLSSFGLFFLCLSLTRFRRILLLADDNSNPISIFLQRHVPEHNSTLLTRTSVALIVSTLFGLLYEGLGARFLNHDLHPEYTVFHYVTHLTLTLLYLFVGWTGLLESYWQLLPKDSIRASAVLALLGETLLWSEHAGQKGNPLNARIHAYLALLSALTALCMITSMISTGSIHGDRQMLPLVTYIGGFLGIAWQGLWFFVAAIHQVRPIASTEYVTVYLVLQAIFLAWIVQLSIIYLRRQQKTAPWSGSLRDEDYSPVHTTQEVEHQMID